MFEAHTIASYNDTNVSSHEVKKAILQSFALVRRCTCLIHYKYIPQDVVSHQLFENFTILFMVASDLHSF